MTKLTVEIHNGADRALVKNAIQIISGVTSVESAERSEVSSKLAEAKEDVKQLDDLLTQAREMLFEVGKELYIHADNNNPFCPLAAAFDRIDGYLAQNLENSRMDSAVKTPEDVMVPVS